ncbi:hypothetical protein [Sodalis sp. RH23]|uniref:hypothetical protein n=1 Tax=unclassified Sodalis (in: enterobacteria) TaxID=2636512 RepID=UPI0039B3AAB1
MNLFIVIKEYWRLITSLIAYLKTSRIAPYANPETCLTQREEPKPVQPLVVATHTIIAKDITMSFSLSSIATAISSSLSVVAGAEKLYALASDLIEKVEAAYATSAGTGQTKKNTVLAVLSVAADGVNTDWETVKNDLSLFIDSGVATYNSVKKLMPAVDSSVVNPSLSTAPEIQATVADTTSLVSP